MEIHQGRWNGHCTLRFADSAQQARIHTVVMPLLQLESAVLADQCQRLGGALGGDGPGQTAVEVAAAAVAAGGGAAEQLDIVRVLAHRQDEHAIRCMRGAVPDYDRAGMAVDMVKAKAATIGSTAARNIKKLLS